MAANTREDFDELRKRCRHNPARVRDKLTPQRLMVVSALRHAEGHVTAAEVLELVQRDYPYVNISTVYRTMAVLKELHLVSETDMGAGELAYEWTSGDPHHHLICRLCGTVQQLDNAALKRLAASLKAESRLSSRHRAHRHFRYMPRLSRGRADALRPVNAVAERP